MAYLTKQERYVLLFLVVGALVGASYSYYKKYHPPLTFSSPDYREMQTSSAPDLDRLLIEEKTVNVNTASVRGLTRLKGIGEVLSQRIVAYRTVHGPFTRIDDLKKVNGIGPKKLEAIKEYIVLE